MANGKRERILLVRVPEVSFNAQFKGDVRSITASGLSVPLGITYIASVIRSKTGLDVRILDPYAERYHEFIREFRNNPEKVLSMATESVTEVIRDFRPEIVGFSAPFSFQHALVAELIDAVKHCSPDIRTYLGGYPTLLPEMVMNSISSLDVLFIGESEKTIIHVLEAEEGYRCFKSIKGIAARIDGRVYINKMLDLPTDLDAIPYPAFDLLPLTAYRDVCDSHTFPLMTSRGCPFDCNFCSCYAYSGRRLRLRGVENLLKEVERLHEKYGMEFMAIRDDNFVVNKNHAKRFLNGMIERGLKVPWMDSSGFHVNSLDEKLLELCKESGCVEAIFAVESGSPRVLKEVMNKKVDLDHVRKMAAFCRTIDLPFQCYFVIGNPGESKDEIQQTIDFAVELQVDHCTFSLATPFPGTKYYDLACEKGYLVNDPQFILGMQQMEANLSTGDFSAEELKTIQYDANMRVNFLENSLLAGNRESLEKALDLFKTITKTYPFHAVARLCQGYIHERLTNREMRDQTFQQLDEMLKDPDIHRAYEKYIHWETRATDTFRQWKSLH